MKKTILTLALSILFSCPVLGMIESEEDNKVSIKHPRNHRFLVQVGDTFISRDSLKISLNKEDYLIDERECYVLGRGGANDEGVLGKIKINTWGSLSAPTKNAKLDVILPDTDSVDAVHNQNFTIYDAFIVPRQLQIQWTKCDSNCWRATLNCPDAVEVTFAGKHFPLEVSFDQQESMTKILDQEDSILNIRWQIGIKESNISFDESTIAIKGDRFLSTITQDGLQIGYYKKVKITSAGRVVTEFSNGFEKDVAQLAVAEYEIDDPILKVME